MKDGWRETTLGEICEFRYGRALKAEERSGSGWPVYGSNGPIGAHDHALTDGPTIIIGRKGSYGEVHYSEGAAWPIDTTYYVDAAASSCDLKWLAYRLAALGLTELNRAAAVPGLNREDAYRLRLLLPPLDEQRHIARVLDAAKQLRERRESSISLVDQLGEAVFLEMTAAANGAWPVVEVGDLVDQSKGGIRTGPFGSQLLHSEFVEKGIAVLGIDNAVANEFRWGAQRYITDFKYRQLRRYTVHPGDVLITIMGTCGKAAVVPDNVGVAINTKHLCCISLDHSRCLPDFLHAYFLRHPTARHYLMSRAKGAIMSGLNMGIIKDLPVSLPPIHLQNELVDRLAAVNRAHERMALQLQRFECLFKSLQQRAFTGAL